MVLVTPVYYSPVCVQIVKCTPDRVIQMSIYGVIRDDVI